MDCTTASNHPSTIRGHLSKKNYRSKASNRFRELVLIHQADSCRMADDVITKGLLEKAFNESGGRADVEVVDFTVSKAASFGDGFMTSMYGVKAVVKEGTEFREIPVVVKAMSTNPVIKNMVIEAKLFKKELGYYEAMVTAFVEFQQKRNVKPLIPALPKFYAGCDDTDDKPAFIMLEDLRPLNFKMANVREGLDVDHCLLVVKELAKLHALSFAYKRGNEDVIHDHFGDRLFDVVKQAEFIEKFSVRARMIDTFQVAIGIFKSSCEDANLKLKLADSFEKKAEDPYAAMTECLSQPTDPYGVICHGDAWCNNMMFRYDAEGRPVEVKLFDLQVCRYALPTTDLAYFLFMSTQQETRQQHFDHLLQSYHSAFLGVLAHLGVDNSGLTVEVLKDMFQRTAFYGVMSAISSLPGILVQHAVHSQIEEMESLDEIVEATQVSKGNHLLQKRLYGIVKDAVLMNL